MRLTSQEREETIAICLGRAQHCRDIAKRISQADQREHMEETARMWAAFAASIDTTVVIAASASAPIPAQ